MAAGARDLSRIQSQQEETEIPTATAAFYPALMPGREGEEEYLYANSLFLFGSQAYFSLSIKKEERRELSDCELNERIHCQYYIIYNLQILKVYIAWYLAELSLLFFVQVFHR